MSEEEAAKTEAEEVKEDEAKEDHAVGDDLNTAGKNITVIKVKPMAVTSTSEDTHLLCLVPVPDPDAATSTTGEADAGDPSMVHKNLAEIQAAQAEVRKLDVLVCGKCHTVFHFVEDFTEHKSDPSCTKPAYRTNINESKPQVWAFLLWKANVGRKLAAETTLEADASSWGLYKRWCKLRPAVRDTWVAAGKAIQVSSMLGAATIKQVHSYPVVDQSKKVKNSDDVFTYTDSVRADKSSTAVKPASSPAPVRVLRTAVKRPLTVKVEEPAAGPRAKMSRRASGDNLKPKATRSTSLRGKKPDGNDSSEEENYVVEKILAKRFNPRIKQFEYLLKWEGYPQDQNTWEPVNHMAECDKLVETFEKSLAKQKAKAAEAGHKVVTKVVKVPVPQAGPSQVSSGRPVRSSKTRAMENVKSWCGSIGGKRPGTDNSDSDDSEPRVKTEYFQYPDNLDENEETKTPGLLKSLSLVKSPGRPKVLRPVNGEQKPAGKATAQTPPVLVANSKGVIKVDSRQVSNLSSGVYIVSNQSGVVKLSGQESGLQPRLLPKGSPSKAATGLVRVQPGVSPMQQKQVQAAHNMVGVRSPRPRLIAPRVLGPRTPTTPPRPRFVPRPPANLRPPAPRLQSPAAQVKSGVRPIQAMLGQQVVTVQVPKKGPEPKAKPAPASKLSQLLMMPKSMKVSQSPLAPKSMTPKVKSQQPVKKHRGKLGEAMDMDFEEPASEESEGEAAAPVFTAADKTPSPLGSPLPLTLCPETGKILGQAEGEPTPTPSPEPDPGNILPDMEPPDEEEEAGTMSGSACSLGHDYAQLVDQQGIAHAADDEDDETVDVKAEVGDGEGEYVTITGDDGVIYQIATNGENLVDGETMLMTEDGQQCVYVSTPGTSTADEANMLSLDSAVAEAVAQMGDSIGANSQIVMRGGDGGQILMTTGEEGGRSGQRRWWHTSWRRGKQVG